MFQPARYVWVCTKRRPDGHKKGSCAHEGSEELVRALKIAAGKAEVDARVTSSGCFDLCWVGPSVAIMPDNVFLKKISAADIPDIVETLRQAQEQEENGPLRLAGALAEKLATDQDFEDPSER